MPKTSYAPTEADKLTGANVRRLRKAAGETLAQTIDRAGLGFSGQSMSRIELGERHLTTPEATKLAAHFNTTADRIIAPQPFGGLTLTVTQPTEQEWLGNEPTALFPVPEKPLVSVDRKIIDDAFVIDLANPLTPDEYRDQVWIPYLEQRYSADLKAS
jgi:transcriptional regulator with XRE-family HTH domain